MVKPGSKYDVLSFVETIQPGSAPAKQRRYFDYALNRRPLAKMLDLGPGDNVGVFGWQSAEVELHYALQLLLREPSELPSGRVPLYICGECGDLGCQSIAVRVSEFEECVVWSAFGYDEPQPGDGFPDSLADLRDFYFLRSEYETAIGRFSSGHRVKPRR